ncbi:MAG: O-antigen ligase family protein [Planctomycetota bacterium]
MTSATINRHERWMSTEVVSGPLSVLLGATNALIFFFGPLDLSADGDTMTVGIDPIVAMKLIVFAIAASLAVYGFLTSSAVRQILQTPPVLVLYALLCLVLIAGPGAVSSASIPTTLINFASIGFVATALVGLGVNRFALAGLIGCLVSVLLAIFLYYVVPRYGVFPEHLADGLIVYRLGGVAHPNSVSRSACLGLIMAIYLYRTRVLSWRYSIFLILVFLIAIYMSFSRTAILASGLALIVLVARQLQSRIALMSVTFAVMTGILLLMSLVAFGREDIVVDKVLAKLSKSGDVEEITSGTGRAQIWGKAVELIGERPLIGHGFNAAPTLMEDFSQSTHNAVLHASLAGGVLAGGLMFVLLLWNVNILLTTDHILIRSITMFLLISCLMEETVLETFAGPCTATWLLGILYAPYVAIAGNDQRAATT